MSKVRNYAAGTLCGLGVNKNEEKTQKRHSEKLGRIIRFSQGPDFPGRIIRFSQAGFSGGGGAETVTTGKTGKT